MLNGVKIEVLSTEEELRAIANIEKEVFRGLAWSWAMLIDEWKNPQSGILLLKLEDKVLGYLIFRRYLDEVEVLRLAISPIYQGMGLGKFLLRSFLSTLQREGIKNVYLEVATTNERAIKLYEQEGFQRVGKRQCYYGNREDALVLNLKLGGLL